MHCLRCASPLPRDPGTDAAAVSPTCAESGAHLILAHSLVTQPTPHVLHIKRAATSDLELSKKLSSLPFSHCMPPPVPWLSQQLAHMAPP